MTTFEDVIGSLKEVNKSFAVNIDQGIALASNLSKCGSDINMEPAMGKASLSPPPHFSVQYLCAGLHHLPPSAKHAVILFPPA